MSVKSSISHGHVKLVRKTTHNLFSYSPHELVYSASPWSIICCCALLLYLLPAHGTSLLVKPN